MDTETQPFLSLVLVVPLAFARCWSSFDTLVQQARLRDATLPPVSSGALPPSTVRLLESHLRPYLVI